MVQCGKDMIKDIVPLLILNIILPTNDVGSDLLVVWTVHQNGENEKAMALLAPVLLNFLFTVRPWWQMESKWGVILTLPLLLAQLWPQYRACVIIYKIIKGDRSAGNEKVLLEREIGTLEPFFESVPSAFLMCFFMTKKLGLEQNELGLCSFVDFGEITLQEFYSFVVSVLSASFGVTKLLQSGPCKIFPEGGLLIGLCTGRFLTAFLSTVCMISGKFSILIGMIILTARNNSKTHLDYIPYGSNFSHTVNARQNELGSISYNDKFQIFYFIMCLIIPQVIWSIFLVKQAVLLGDEGLDNGDENDEYGCSAAALLYLGCSCSCKGFKKWRNDVALLIFRYPAIFLTGSFSTFTFGIDFKDWCSDVSSIKSKKVVFTKFGTLGNIVITWIGAGIYVFLCNFKTMEDIVNFGGNENIYLVCGWLFLGSSLMALGSICSIIFMTFDTCCCSCCPKDCVGLEYHSIEVVGQYELKLGPHMPTKVTDD